MTIVTTVKTNVPVQHPASLFRNFFIFWNPADGQISFILSKPVEGPSKSGVSSFIAKCCPAPSTSSFWASTSPSFILMPCTSGVATWSIITTHKNRSIDLITNSSLKIKIYCVLRLLVLCFLGFFRF